MVSKFYVNSDSEYTKFFQRSRAVSKYAIPKSKINPHSHNAIALGKTQSTDPMSILIQILVPSISTQFTSDPTLLVKVESPPGSAPDLNLL